MAGALLGVLMMLLVFPFGGAASALVASRDEPAGNHHPTAGAAFPLLFDRMGLDPALMSTPFITTCTDVAGTLIYLKTADGCWCIAATGKPQVFLPISLPWAFSRACYVSEHSSHNSKKRPMARLRPLLAQNCCKDGKVCHGDVDLVRSYLGTSAVYRC